MRSSLTRWIKAAVLAAAVAFALELTTAAPTNRASRGQSPKPDACGGQQYHQFDFWLGDWDAFEIGVSKPDARVRVTRILDGCVIHEDYQQPDRAKGESFSIYDSSRKVWHQSWVTNGGKLLVIEGQFANGKMVMTGMDHFRQNVLVRGTWLPIPDGIRETAVLSSDGGTTWKPWFDLYFRRHKAGSPN